MELREIAAFDCLFKLNINDKNLPDKLMDTFAIIAGKNTKSNVDIIKPILYSETN